MRYLILILALMSICYGSSGYAVGRNFISALGSCETSATRTVGYNRLVAAIRCQHGGVFIFEEPLSLMIIVSNKDQNDKEDDLNLSRMTLKMTTSYSRGEYEYDPSARVTSFDRLGIAEDFDYVISDEEIKSLYKGLIQGRTFRIERK